MAILLSTSGWSSTITLLPNQPYTYVATPGTGGSVILQWSADGQVWYNFQNSPSTATIRGAIPPGAAYIRGTATGATGTFDYAFASDAGAGTFTAAQAANAQALTSGVSSAPVAALDSSYSRVQSLYFPCNDGSGTTLAESPGKGPSISIAGTTTGAWGTASWFTHDAGGNTLQLKNLPYVDGLINMTTDGAIIVACDFYLTTWPTSASEYLWCLHRGGESTTGGLTLSISNASLGRYSVNYKSNGGSTNEVVGFTMGTYLSVRTSLLVEAVVNTTSSLLSIFFYINGRLERSNNYPLGTPPATDAACGLNFSGYGATPSNKLGTGGSAGERVQNLFVARHDGSDRNIAGRLARDLYANAALPTWLLRV